MAFLFLTLATVGGGVCGVLMVLQETRDLRAQREAARHYIATGEHLVEWDARFIWGAGG